MVRFLLIYSWVFKALLACSCGPTAPACQLIGTTPVVFLGTVIASIPDPKTPLGASNRIYRFGIDRAYKGLAKEQKEIVINPENSTSCRTSYKVGKQYLMFATSWDLTNPKAETYQAGGCSGSRETEWARKDIEFLESYSQGNSTPRVYGATLQWLKAFGPTSDDETIPAPGARVTLRSGTASWERLSRNDGTYSFEGLSPGAYTISARLDSFSASSGPRIVEVPAHGCAEQMFDLPSDTELSGLLLDDRGRPASKTAVGLLRRDNAAQAWRGVLGLFTYTDAAGHFEFQRIPTGDYLLGYEIRGDGPSFRSAVPTTYFPGTAKQSEATVLHLEPNQKIRNLTFKLLPPQTPRLITIDIVWADGTKPGNHLLQISSGDELLQNLGGMIRPHIPNPPQLKGGFAFTGYQERQYKISARYWVDELGGPVPLEESRVAETNVAVVQPGSGPVKIRLVLGQPKLAQH